jgi:ATP-binding cassette subfamily F protein 3
LNLALVTHHAPALLILDEPTNHLDIEAREALVQAINDFPGAVVLVSHDWHLLELVADRLWLVADGTVRPFEGDLEDYERRVLEGGGSANATRSSDSQSCSRRDARRLAAKRRRELEPLRQAARGAEEKITRLIAEREAIDRVLAQPPGPRDDGSALTAALKRRAEVMRLLERAEIEWLTAEESLEGEAR